MAVAVVKLAETPVRILSIFLTGLFLFFSNPNNFTEKNGVGFSGIWTRIVEVEGEYADHLTTTTAPFCPFLPHKNYFFYE